MITIRCSALDTVLKCNGSLDGTDVPYDPINDEATEGQAAHRAAESIPRGEEPEWEAIRQEFDCDLDEVQKLYRKAKWMWDNEISQWCSGEVLTEQRMVEEIGEGIQLAGTSDLLSLSYDEAELDKLVVVDWKFGHQPPEHPHQLRGYARLATGQRGMPKRGYVNAIEVWVRLGEIISKKFIAADLTRLDEEIIRQVTGQKQYGPSHYSCRFCRHQNHCQARAEWMQSSVVALMPVGENRPVTPEFLGQYYDVAKQLRKALDNYDALTKEIIERDGAIPLPDGRRLILEERISEKIRASKALSFLRDNLDLSGDEIDEVLTIAKTGLERVNRARGAAGRKGAALQRQTMEGLRASGAIDEVVTKRKRAVSA